MVDAVNSSSKTESFLHQRLDENILDSLDEEQREAVGQALESSKWSREHPLNIRLSVPFFGKRFYLTVVGGTEKRSLERHREERNSHPIRTFVNIVFALACVGGASFLMLVLLALYSSLVEF